MGPNPFVWLFNAVVDFYILVLVVAAVLSWLVAFSVVNPHNRVVSVIGDITYRLTDPALRPIRRYVPLIGGIDISFLVLWFGVEFFRRMVNFYIF